MFVPAVPLFQHIYTQQGGLTQTEIGVVQAVTWLVVLITDVPTGRLADGYSYKRMLAMAGIFYGASFGALAFATSFWAFIGSSVLLGLGTSCFRGVPNSLARLAIKADESDLAKADRRFASFVRTNLILTAIGEAAASGVAWLIVNKMGDFGLRAVSLSAVVTAVAMLWMTGWGVMDLRPQEYHVSRSFLVIIGSGWAETARNVRNAYRESGRLRAMLLFGAVIGCTTQTMVWLSQAYLQRSGVSLLEMPKIWMWYHVALAGFVLVAIPLRNKHGATKVLTVLPLVAVAGYVALIIVPADIGQWLMLVFYLIRAIQMPLVQMALNDLSPEHLRATLIGVMSSVQFILFCVMNFTIQWLVQVYGTDAAFGFSAIVYGLLGYLTIWHVQRHERKG